MTALVATSTPPATSTHQPPGLPLVGQLFDVWRDPIALMVAGMATGAPLVRYRFGPFTYFLANDPDDVERVLVKDAKLYGKSPSYRALMLVMGQGLVTSNGDLWRRQRKLMQPAFHHRSLVGFVDQMRGCTEAFVQRWADRTPGEVFDVHEEMMRLTFGIVGQTLFSTDLEEDAAEVGQALGFLLQFAADATETVVRVPTWLPTRRNLRFKKSMKVVDDVIARIVEDRRRQDAAPQDLLGLLLAAEMSRQQLRDELVTLALAGHETTATAMSWTWLLLSQHPDVARKARQEILQVAGDGPIDFAVLSKLDYVERVIQESMRIFPPVWGIERQVQTAHELHGQALREGDIVLMCPYTMQRDPRLWPNPEGFDPDRFLHSNVRHRFSYFPFGGGARVCIGKSFAMMEAKLILAELLRRFDLALVPGFKVAMDAGITLRPAEGIQMTMRPVGP